MGTPSSAKGAQTEIASATVTALGKLTFTVDGGDFGPGEYTLFIDYLGVFGSFRPSEAPTPELTVTQPDTGPGEVVAMTSLSVTPGKVKSGSNVTLEGVRPTIGRDQTTLGVVHVPSSRQGSGGPWFDHVVRERQLRQRGGQVGGVPSRRSGTLPSVVQPRP